MSAPKNNTENHEVVLRELGWLPGNKLARLSAAETLEPPGKTNSRRVSQWNWTRRWVGGHMLQEGGKFDKQSFVVHWEEKDVICQVHTLGSFALYVKQRQEKKS